MATVTVDYTKDFVLEEAADAAAYADERAVADAILARGRRRIGAMELLPEGWRVTRRAYPLAGRQRSTTYVVRDEQGCAVRSATCVRVAAEDGGGTSVTWTAGVDSASAGLAQAVALLLASIDAEAHARAES